MVRGLIPCTTWKSFINRMGMVMSVVGRNGSGSGTSHSEDEGGEQHGERLGGGGWRRVETEAKGFCWSLDLKDKDDQATSKEPLG